MHYSDLYLIYIYNISEQFQKLKRIAKIREINQSRYTHTLQKALYDFKTIEWKP